MPLLNVNINESLLRDFRRFAVEKHGRIYGVLKPEIERALVEYLASQKKEAKEQAESEKPQISAFSNKKKSCGGV